MVSSRDILVLGYGVFWRVTERGLSILNGCRIGAARGKTLGTFWMAVLPRDVRLPIAFGGGEHTRSVDGIQWGGYSESSFRDELGLDSLLGIRTGPLS